VAQERGGDAPNHGAAPRGPLAVHEGPHPHENRDQASVHLQRVDQDRVGDSGYVKKAGKDRGGEKWRWKVFWNKTNVKTLLLT